MSGGTRRDEFVREKNRLLQAMRTTELVDEKRQQVRNVVADNDSRPLRAQLEAVWQHHAGQSKLFQTIEAEAPIPDSVRAENIKRVNEWQAVNRGRAIQPSPQRFIDIYGRYNCGEMDPLMLALIARTVGWYVDNRHAQLFTKVRLVPDYCRNNIRSIDAIPWAALAANPKMSLLKVQDYAFTSSLMGANRMFLTHSAALEATREKSIPIIGLATWKNSDKYNKYGPYALLAADFDKKDQFRSANRTWSGEDQRASLAGTIDETLRALREVETLEIARAQNIPLEIDANHRWAPTGKLTDKSPSRDNMRELSKSSLSFGK